VIGNSEYAHAAPLANPVNDATDVGTALDRLGFDVTRLTDTDEAALEDGLRDFGRAAAGAEVAVVFYAGHGIEVDGRNHLVPVDARLGVVDDVDYETVPLRLVERAVSRVSGFSLVILDACRDNPFALAGSGQGRSVGRGLARVEPPGDTMIAYAAREGQVAADGVGTGRNSPFTEELLAHLETPGLRVIDLFGKVKEAVRTSSGGRQEPVIYGIPPVGGVYLARSPAVRPDPPLPSVPDTGGGTGTEGPDAAQAVAARAYYEAAERIGTVEAFDAFIRRFPQSDYSDLARAAIAGLEDVGGSDPQPGADVAVATPAPVADPEDIEDTLGLRRDDRRFVQLALKDAGFDPGWADGVLGPRSRAALEGWQQREGHARTGHLTGPQLATLREAGRAIDARDRERAVARGAARGRELLNGFPNLAMHLAANESNLDAMLWLKEQGVDVNKRAAKWAEYADVTPMFAAAWGGQVDAMRWLKAQGADVNARDKYGQTSMGVAKEYDRANAVNWLRANGGRE